MLNVVGSLTLELVSNPVLLVMDGCRGSTADLSRLFCRFDWCCRTEKQTGKTIVCGRLTEREAWKS